MADPASRPVTSRGSRAAVAVFAGALSSWVNIAGGAFDHTNDASVIGLLVGIALLSLFVYWLAGKIAPVWIAFGLAGVGVVVLVARSQAPAPNAPIAEATSAPSPDPTTSSVAAPTASVETIRVYDRTGKAADIPYDRATEAVRSGKYGLLKGTRVPVVLEDGEVGTVLPDEISDVLANGGRLATPKEYAAAPKR